MDALAQREVARCSLGGPRVLLRNWHRQRDRAESLRWPAPDALTLALAPRWGGRQGARRSFAIVVHATGQLAGRVVLGEFGTAPASARVGIYLAPGHIGRGYGTESLLMLSLHAFGGLGLEELHLDVLAANSRAWRCYERCGYRRRAEEWRPIPSWPGEVIPEVRQAGGQLEALTFEYRLAWRSWE